MRIFTISAFTGLSFLIFSGSALFAQQNVPQKVNSELQRMKDVDGRQAVANARPYYITQPGTSNPANTNNYQPLFIKSPMPASKNLSLVSEKGAQQLAFELLDMNAGKLQIVNANQSFTVIKQDNDNLGFSHIKMQQLHQGIPVFGVETYVHLKDGQDGIINGKCIPVSRLSNISTVPSIGFTKAQDIALASVKTETGFVELSADAKKILKYDGPEKELVIFPDFKDDKKLNLAWHFTIRPNALERWEYFIDAQTGDILFKYDNTCTDGPVTGQGTDLKNLTRGLNLYLVGSKYYLVDASKSMFNAGTSSLPDNPMGAIRTVSANYTDLGSILDISSTTNSFWPDASAVSAHYNAGIAYDYYEKTFGRKGLDGNGSTMLSVVNVTAGGQAMDNAYWNGQLMAYGNGKALFNTPLAAALDVTGHEMTHGVIQSTANLTYQDESGAINESFADIFGCMIERKNWYIGEDVVNYAYFPSGALRDLSDPHNGGSGPSSASWQPAKKSEKVITTADHGGVHVNSGIPNYAFYLIATATSKDTAEKIYFRALTLYLTRSSQFIDLRLAVIQSATDLFGAGSKEVKAAKTAFDKVEIFDGSGNDFQQDLNPVFGTDLLMVQKTSFRSGDTALYLVQPKPAKNSDYHGISINQAYHKPSITDDGQRGYYIGMDNNIYKIGVDTLKYKITKIGYTGYYWNNIAVSKDSTKLALTRTPNDTSIYILNLTNLQATRYHLFNPTYASGINNGGPVYANSLEWDPTGEYVMYDSYNQIGTGSTKINYWDVGFLKGWDNVKAKFGDGSINKLFASLPKGVDITNPTYSKNSPFIIAYDYFDENTQTYKVYTSNIEHGYDSAIYVNNTYGYPTFSKNDDKLAFTSINSNKDTIIAEIALNASKMSPNGSASAIMKGYKWPVWYTRGLRKGVKALYNTVNDQVCQSNSNMFYSSSLGKVKTYSWNFGTNATPQTATTAGPIAVKYNKAGTQTVTLTVKDSGAITSNTISGSVFVYAAAVLSITQGSGSNDLTLNSNLSLNNAQWYFNGKPLSGANALVITADKSGDYYAEGEASTGCISASPVFHFVNSGIDASHPLVNVNIYPNPGSGIFNLEIEMGTSHPLALHVYNLLGQDMYHEQITNTIGISVKQIDLSAMPKGIYMLKMESEKSTYTEKIVIR